MEECGSCPVFASFTLAFALQLRKKHGKPSGSLRKTSVTVQYTYYQTHPHITSTSRMIAQANSTCRIWDSRLSLACTNSGEKSSKAVERTVPVPSEIRTRPNPLSPPRKKKTKSAAAWSNLLEITFNSHRKVRGYLFCNSTILLLSRMI